MANKIFVQDSSIGNMGSELHVGAVTLNDIAGQYYAMQCLTDITPFAMGLMNSTGYNVAPASYVIPAGTIIYGDFAYIITQAAGSAMILYKR
tara:strand:+ start:282 stop:557 length:276 start_codon:yes stop_codon:yes gene_type:complete